MMKIGIDLWDAAEVLSTGNDCSQSQRVSSKVERCLRVGKKVIRIVADLRPFDLYDDEEEAYFIIHASLETIKKDRLKRWGV